MATFVNGERVKAESIARERALLEARYREAGQPVEEAKLDADARANAVEKLLLRQRARETVPTVPGRDVQRRLDRIAEEHGGLGAYCRSLGLPPSAGDVIRGVTREEIRYERFIARLCKDVPAPSEDELRTYYDAHPERFKMPETVHAAHVVYQPAPAQGSAEVTMNLMNLRQEILNGSTLRGRPHRIERGIGGGDLGYIPRGQVDEAFDRVVFGLNPGEVSDVFRTSMGYHVVEVFDRRPARTLTFDEVRTQLREEMWRDRKNEHVGRWVDGMLSEAEIVEREEEDA